MLLALLLLAPILSVSSVHGATLTFGTSMPTVTSDGVSSSVGAAFDAANIGGNLPRDLPGGLALTG